LIHLRDENSACSRRGPLRPGTMKSSKPNNSAQDPTNRRMKSGNLCVSGDSLPSTPLPVDVKDLSLAEVAHGFKRLKLGSASWLIGGVLAALASVYSAGAHFGV